MTTSSIPNSSATLTWRRHDSYESARNEKGIIYLFEWNDKPFYWGIAQKSAFGTRYNVGYRHLIEASLRHEGKLYIATVSDNGELPLPEIENYLIVTFGHEMNSRIKENPESLQLTHQGDVPNSLATAAGQQPGHIDHDPVEPLRKRAHTYARRKPFEYELTPSSLIIYRGKELGIRNEVQGDKLLQLLEKLSQNFGNGWFPLDNNVTPLNDGEHGLGTTIQIVFETNRGFVSIASHIAKLLCEASILARRIRKGGIYGGKYQLSNQPESWAELRERLENLATESAPY